MNDNPWVTLLENPDKQGHFHLRVLFEPELMKVFTTASVDEGAARLREYLSDSAKFEIDSCVAEYKLAKKDQQ